MASVDEAITELYELLDGRHEVNEAFVRALNYCGAVTGDPAPQWRAVAAGLRQCADLADFLATQAQGRRQRSAADHRKGRG